MAKATKVRATMFPRFWEDARVNGTEDTEGVLIPFRLGEAWAITIHTSDGSIDGWPRGITAQVHYKVCDAGTYQILGEDGSILSVHEGYVPEYMSPKEPGFGDYVIMDIDAEGRIGGWLWIDC